MKLEYPRITGENPVQQLKQLQSWLYTLVETLNLADGHSGAESPSHAYGVPATFPQGGQAGVSASENFKISPTGSFNAIKSLIIKSADIIDAYTLAIGDGLSGRYVAEAVFPSGSAKYVEETSARITKSTKDIDVLFSQYNEIFSDIDSIKNQELETSAYIKAGELFVADEDFVNIMDLPDSDNLIPGTPVYGVAVGQTTNEFKAFARFTAFGLLFYDKDDNLVAYITKQEMRIRRVRILESLQRGGYVERILPDGSTVEKWEGV